MSDLHDYERVHAANSPDVHQIGRLKVPGGWLYMTFSQFFGMGGGAGECMGQTVSQTFVADPPVPVIIHVPLGPNDKIFGKE